MSETDSTTPLYPDPEPRRAEIDAASGPLVVEFGAPWCGHCQRAQALIAEAFADRPGLRHLRIEDGPGRRLGRSFAVKLWPTLIFLDNGREVARLVRPAGVDELRAALAAIDTASDAA